MAKLINQKEQELTIEIKVKIGGSLLEVENNILDACNEVGNLATEKALEQYDTDGSPIKIGEINFTAKKQQVNKSYQTPYGTVEVKRYVYQTAKGGKLYCPLEDNARIIQNATPKFAQQISHKYSNMNAPSVCRDLEDNHHRKIAHSYLQDVSEWVASIAEAKEETWEYSTPKINKAINTIVFSLDGAYLLMRKDGYREAMVGCISLYDIEGERQHSIYIGEAPEYGKATFIKRLETEISQIKQKYPNAHYLGIADGAKNNWTLLKKHTDQQLLDFFHVTEYLSDVSYAAYPRKSEKPKREIWLSERCKKLKHEYNYVDNLITQMKKLYLRKNLSNIIREKLSSALTYFVNNKKMMNYANNVKNKLPIGSGVTEAACKTLVKQRLCGSGMRWNQTGAKVVLSLRGIIQSTGRWLQFWNKINQYGAQVC